MRYKSGMEIKSNGETYSRNGLNVLPWDTYFLLAFSCGFRVYLGYRSKKH